MNTLVSTSYKKLIADIVQLYERARKSQVDFYWNTGRRIVEVEQGGSKRAPHDSGLLRRLSEDLSAKLGSGFSVTNLQRMRLFFLANPKYATSTNLTWSQQVELLRLENHGKRLVLERKAVREGLSVKALRKLVRSEYRRSDGQKLSRSAGRAPLAPIKGRIGIYRIIESDGALHWDKGFASYRELSGSEARTLKKDDFVTLNKNRLEKIAGKPADLYTYEATLDRVIDADTFWMKIWLARPEWRREKLRLRGIDCPELNTPEGQAAKRFVEGLFRKARKITVTTTKPDKYHRYLSDVFLEMEDGGEIFLNNHLLEKGRAVRTDAIPPSEWEKE
jgi:endonuclease YncB( thermonuclease family)